MDQMEDNNNYTNSYGQTVALPNDLSLDAAPKRALSAVFAEVVEVIDRIQNNYSIGNAYVSVEHISAELNVKPTTVSDIFGILASVDIIENSGIAKVVENGNSLKLKKRELFRIKREIHDKDYEFLG